MNEESKLEIDTQEITEAARTAVEGGKTIREDVRNITLKALSEGHLDVKKVSQVIRAVTEGAGIGAEAKGDQVKDALSDAISGMDEALAKSAEASRLAIEETAGHVKNFSEHDLKQALNDLQVLESLFVETVHDVGKSASEMVKGVLADLIKHSQQSGTSVGKTSSEAVDSLTHKLGSTLKESASDSAKVTLGVGVHIANTAAGILEGIADTLQSRSKK